MAIGIPAGEEDPLIFDASTSVVARGKIIVAAHTKTPIPEGWAIDPDGYPTTDPEQALAGAVLPFGGPKGSAISFIIDILCGVMTGASFALHLNTLEDLATEQNVGHVLAAVRTDLFVSESQFKERMDAILRMLRASPPAPAGNACWRRARSNSPTNHEAASRASRCPRRSPRNWPALARSSTSRFLLRGRVRFFGACSLMNLDAGQGFNFLPIPTDVHFGFGSSALVAGPRAIARPAARRSW